MTKDERHDDEPKKRGVHPLWIVVGVLAGVAVIAVPALLAAILSM